MRSPRASTVVGALLVGALFVSAPGSIATQNGGGQGGDEQAIQDLLDRRAKAVRDGDLDAFMATIGQPDSPFGRAQRRTFQNLGAIPLAQYDLEASWASYGDLARPVDRARYEGAESVKIPLTIERYRIEGFDEKPVRQDLYLTFVRRDGRWGIEGDADLDDLGFMTQKNLWDFSPVETQTSDRLLTIAPVGSSDLSGVLDAATRALQRVERYWPTRLWSGKVPIYIPGDPESLSRIIQATFPVENYVAFSFWTGGIEEAPGARIIVNPDGFSGASAARSFEILVHELMHVAAIPSSSTFIPLFVQEGLAQYVQYDGSWGAIAEADAVSTGELPDDDVFFDSDQNRILAAYDHSLSAVAFTIETWGLERFVSFYRRLGAVGFDPGTPEYQLDRALRKTLGVGLDRFKRRWASSIGA